MNFIYTVNIAIGKPQINDNTSRNLKFYIPIIVISQRININFEIPVNLITF